MRKANSLRKAASPTPLKVLPLTLVTLCIIAIVGITLWRLPPSRTVAAVVPTPSPVSSILRLQPPRVDYIKDLRVADR